MAEPVFWLAECVLGWKSIYIQFSMGEFLRTVFFPIRQYFCIYLRPCDSFSVGELRVLKHFCDDDNKKGLFLNKKKGVFQTIFIHLINSIYFFILCTLGVFLYFPYFYFYIPLEFILMNLRTKKT
jgi:hypothetical protein